MLVQTIDPQVVNPQTGKKEIVFFDIPSFMFDKYKKIWIFNVVSFWIAENAEGKDVRVVINESVAIFKRDTFIKIFSGITADDLTNHPGKLAELLIREIDFINKYKKEASYEYAKFWDLKAKDLINLCVAQPTKE